MFAFDKVNEWAFYWLGHPGSGIVYKTKVRAVISPFPSSLREVMTPKFKTTPGWPWRGVMVTLNIPVLHSVLRKVK